MAGTTGLEADQAVLQNSNNAETQTPQNPTESDTRKENALPGKDKSTATSDTSEQGKDTILRQKCATGVLQNFDHLPAELKLVIEVWPTLSDEARETIMALITKNVGRK